MPTVTFAPGTESSFNSFILGVDALGGDVDLVDYDETTIVFQSGDTVYTLSGSGFTFGFTPNGPGVTGGTVEGLAVVTNGAPGMTITGLGLSAVVLQNAIFAEGDGSDTTALEDVFLPLDWTYHGNGNTDILLESSVSADGAPLNFSGNDTFLGKGGNDNLFLGDGNDTGRGGNGSDRLNGWAGDDTLYGDAGDDVLDGGFGNDKAYGGSGNDSFSGGGQNDSLFGGAGADFMFGGANKDTIRGGTGNDELWGDGGADRFVFADGDGGDVINDFNLGSDKIDVADPSLVTFQDAGGNTRMFYGPGFDSIMLFGVDFNDAALIDII